MKQLKFNNMHIDISFFKKAHELNEKCKVLFLKENVNLRGSANSMSMISKSQETSQLGITCHYIYKTPEENRELILQDIAKIKAMPVPERPTPEKELQSWIINYALNNNNQMPFDSNIKFITSELAIQDIYFKSIIPELIFNNGAKNRMVADIIGFDMSKKQLCVIELKAIRSLKELINQVENFEKVMNVNRDFFTELLNLSDFVSIDKVKKIIVWPNAITSPLKVLKDKDIVEITYERGKDNNFIFS